MDKPNIPLKYSELTKDKGFIVSIDREERCISMLFYEPLWGLRFTREGAQKLIETVQAYIETLDSLKSDTTN